MGGYDELRTERVLSRRWREADRAPFAALNADPVQPRPGGRLAADCWGRGYATEAARVAIEVGLRHEPGIVGMTAPTNGRSG